MCVPLSNGFENALRLSKTAGRETAWWRRDAVLYWPYCFYQVSSSNLKEHFRESEKLENTMVFTRVIAKEQNETKDIFDWQFDHGDINICSGVGNTVSINREYTSFLKKKTREVGKHPRFALAASYIDLEQCRDEMGRQKEIFEYFDTVYVSSTHTWGLIYGSMIWYDLIDEIGLRRDLVLEGPVSTLFLPVLAHLKSIWPGEVYFIFDPMEPEKYRMPFHTSVLDLPKERTREKAKYPCVCPFCGVVGEKALGKEDLMGMVRLHNMFTIINEWLFWCWLAKNEKREMLKRAKDYKLHGYFEFINQSIQWGWERAVKTLWYISIGSYGTEGRGGKK